MREAVRRLRGDSSCASSACQRPACQPARKLPKLCVPMSSSDRLSKTKKNATTHRATVVDKLPTTGSDARSRTRPVLAPHGYLEKRTTASCRGVTFKRVLCEQCTRLLRSSKAQDAGTFWDTGTRQKKTGICSVHSPRGLCERADQLPVKTENKDEDFRTMKLTRQPRVARSFRKPACTVASFGVGLSYLSCFVLDIVSANGWNGMDSDAVVSWSMKGTRVIPTWIHDEAHA